MILGVWLLQSTQATSPNSWYVQVPSLFSNTGVSRAHRSTSCLGELKVSLVKSIIPKDNIYLSRQNCKTHLTCQKLTTVNQHHKSEVFTLPPQEMLPTNGMRPHANHKYQTCAVVGNSGTLTTGIQYGNFINTHDVVMRINQGPTEGYEAIVGTRTTHRFLNRLWTLAYADSSLVAERYRFSRFPHPMETGVSFVTSRTTPQSSVMMWKKQLALGNLRNDIQILILNEQLVQNCQTILKQYRMCASSKSGVHFGGGDEPTSGLVAILLLRSLCAEVRVFGMGVSARVGSDTPYQYYKLHNTQRAAGNIVHSFRAESAVINALGTVGAISLCKPEGCYVAGVLNKHLHLTGTLQPAVPPSILYGFPPNPPQTNTRKLHSPAVATTNPQAPPQDTKKIIQRLNPPTPSYDPAVKGPIDSAPVARAKVISKRESIDLINSSSSRLLESLKRPEASTDKHGPTDEDAVKWSTQAQQQKVESLEGRITPIVALREEDTIHSLETPSPTKRRSFSGSNSTLNFLDDFEDEISLDFKQSLRSKRSPSASHGNAQDGSEGHLSVSSSGVDGLPRNRLPIHEDGNKLNSQRTV